MRSVLFRDITRCVWWQFLTNVSGQPVSPILNGQGGGTDRLSQNVGKELLPYAA